MARSFTSRAVSCTPWACRVGGTLWAGTGGRSGFGEGSKGPPLPDSCLLGAPLNHLGAKPAHDQNTGHLVKSESQVHGKDFSRDRLFQLQPYQSRGPGIPVQIQSIHESRTCLTASQCCRPRQERLSFFLMSKGMCNK